ncbi:MAG TPA: CpaF family protein [Gaiellaceae bacterium]|nr:CpaF family protein [Gaiellaceae bacterium]
MSLQERLNGQESVEEASALQSRIGSNGADLRVDRFADLRTSLHDMCISKLGPELIGSESDVEALRKRVREVVTAELRKSDERLTTDEREDLIGEVVADVLGYGPIDRFVRDRTVTEIMVNGPDQVFVERAGILERTDVRFTSEDHLTRVIDRIVSAVGRRIDEASPMVDARLPDGSRVNAIVPPLSLQGPVLTIRKFSAEALSDYDLVLLGTLTPELVEVFSAAVKGKLNILISGGTGVGKTTLLNVMSGFIPDRERIISIEDAAELQLQQPHVVSLESRPANIEGQGEIRIRDLVRNALRMRPDRIVVGEVRGPETVDMLQAMNTGHEGSMTTIHANSPRDALARVETLVLTAGVELPLRAIREQVASAFDLIIQLARLVDGTRVVTHVTEVLRMESEVVTLQDLFVARPAGVGSSALLEPIRPTGVRPHFVDKLKASQLELSPELFDPIPAAERLAIMTGRRPR